MYCFILLTRNYSEAWSLINAEANAPADDIEMHVIPLQFAQSHIDNIASNCVAEIVHKWTPDLSIRLLCEDVSTEFKDFFKTWQHPQKANCRPQFPVYVENNEYCRMAARLQELERQSGHEPNDDDDRKEEVLKERDWVASGSYVDDGSN